MNYHTRIFASGITKTFTAHVQGTSFVTSGLLFRRWKYTDTTHNSWLFWHLQGPYAARESGFDSRVFHVGFVAEWQRQVCPDYFGFPVVSSYSADVPYSFIYICIYLWRYVFWILAELINKPQRLTCTWISHAWDTLVRRTICGFYSQVCVYFKFILLVLTQLAYYFWVYIAGNSI